MPLIHKNIPGKIGEPAIGSLGQPAAVLAAIRRGRRCSWPERWGEGSRAHPSSILLVGWGGLMAGRRRPASAAAAAGNSDEAKAELGNTRRGKLLCGPGNA
jgi:hypothetical protein